MGLRRLRLVVGRFPRFGEALEVATFCSGTGALVAERRSTVLGGGGARGLEAVALWVHLDPDGAHPRPLPDGLRGRLRRGGGGAPRAGAAAPSRRAARRRRGRPWRFRAADLDLAGHVNNAVYWQVLEEELVPADPPGADAEIEYRAAGGPGEAAVVADDGMRWITAAARGARDGPRGRRLGSGPCPSP